MCVSTSRLKAENLSFLRGRSSRIVQDKVRACGGGKVMSLPPIDQEWALSLIGLLLDIPDHWWPAYKGSNTLNRGKIVGVNFQQDHHRKYWTVNLDADDEGRVLARSTTRRCLAARWRGRRGAPPP